MKNHFTERCLTALWFGILGYLLIPFFIFSFHLTLTQILLSSLLSFFAVCVGFFYGYKVFFQAADDLSQFITKVTALVWGGTIGIAIAEIILGLISNSSPPVPLTMLVLPMLSGLVFMVGGLLYGYRILLLPKVTYIKLFPTLTERIVSMLWFGLLGGLLQALFIHGPLNPNSIFIITLASYLGFAYGYRILLLPASLKAAIKSLMLGFMGSSYILSIIILLIFIPTYFHPIALKSFQPPVISPIIDSIAASIIMEFYLFLALSTFICTLTMAFALILYLFRFVCIKFNN